MTTLARVTFSSGGKSAAVTRFVDSDLEVILLKLVPGFGWRLDFSSRVSPAPIDPTMLGGVYLQGQDDLLFSMDTVGEVVSILHPIHDVNVWDPVNVPFATWQVDPLSVTLTAIFVDEGTLWVPHFPKTAGIPTICVFLKLGTGEWTRDVVTREPGIGAYNDLLVKALPPSLFNTVTLTALP